MFTKRHYQAVAKLLNAHLKGLGHIPNVQDRAIVTQFIELFEQDNKSFVKEAFLNVVWKEVV